MVEAEGDIVKPALCSWSHLVQAKGKVEKIRLESEMKLFAGRVTLKVDTESNEELRRCPTRPG